MGIGIEVVGLFKYFGSVAAVNDISFSVKEQEFYSLLGPSGCGKTTTLRCIAGLEQPSKGSIKIGDRVMSSASEGICIPPEKRGIGMVFQNYAVWPHMNVEQNISYPLRITKVPSEKVRDRVNEVMDMLKLTGLGKRFPSELSGGQQQRVALGRALSIKPAIMLLDEPLSNLDAKLREQMRFELKDLQRNTGIAILYVTHDQVEAMAMSDRVAIMKDGVIIQEGKPLDIYKNPKEKFVADFIGTTNFIECDVIGSSASSTDIRLESGSTFTVPEATDIRGRCTLALRPEDIELSAEGTDGFEAEVEVGIFLGNVIDYRIKIGNSKLRVQSTVATMFRPGDKVRAKVGRVVLFN